MNEKVTFQPGHGRIRSLHRHDGYGFLETDDRREIYFHSSALPVGEFQQLDVGMRVRFREEMGDKGPRATWLRIVGRRASLTP